MAFDEKQYIKDFNKKHYDVVTFKVYKGNKKVLKELAKIKGSDMSKIIIEAVENYYHIDISSKQDDEEV